MVTVGWERGGTEQQHDRAIIAKINFSI